MHIPDGFLDAKTASATAALSIAGLGVALKQLRFRLPARRVPLLGLAAAFVFAAQMLNFPVAGGTSGHLIGGVLTSVLLGPSAAVVVLSAVLIVQCFLFADGGVLALGANIFNMAIVGSVGGYGIYRGVRAVLRGRRGTIVAVAFASWCATVLAAISCAGQLAWSGTVSWKAAFPAMAGVHMLVGLGEAFITALVIVAVANVRPELVEEAARTSPSERYGEIAAFGLLMVLGVALFVAPFACPWPDTVQNLVSRLGIETKASHPLVAAPFADYHLPGIDSAVSSVALAGAIGTLVVFGLAFVLARLLVPGTKDGTPSAPR